MYKRQESSTVREYHTKYAAHILGYMGGMDDDDWAKYKNAGYSMDAYIGQSLETTSTRWPSMPWR